MVYLDYNDFTCNRRRASQLYYSVWQQYSGDCGWKYNYSHNHEKEYATASTTKVVPLTPH